MHPMLTIAVAAARKAGSVILRGTERLDLLRITEKNANDFVTDVDTQAEAVIIETLRHAYPHHSILAEESGESGNSDYVWIIDPLDGTRNFMHGFAHFCVSIALKVKSQLEHCVIFDPIRQEIFTASRGRGAFLDNKRIRVSTRYQLAQGLIGTGFPFRHKEQGIPAYLQLLGNLLTVCGDIRRAGSAALDLAYVASGRLDGFFELKLKPWDIAAGSLLIQEAGGLVSDLRGGENYLVSGDIVAGNPKIFKALLKQLHADMTP